MTITIDSKLDAQLRERADAAGLTVTAYVERMLTMDESAEEELEALALEGVNSGIPVEVNPSYWSEKHRRLDERLKAAGVR